MKNLFSLLCLAVLIGCSFCGCGGNGDQTSESLSLDMILSDSVFNPYEQHLDSAPDEGCVKLKVRPVGPLRRTFNDSNYKHLQAAAEIGTGIIQDINEAWRLKRHLVGIRSCAEYYVDDLTHSYGYLVPEAAALLKEIGSRFNDSLAARGGGSYRLKVTSLMRTPATVRRLRRINRNATDSSAHQFATTFDISYSKFICDSVTVPRSFEDLKNLLAEILFELRRDGRCYIVFERRQSCFHITARPLTSVTSEKS